MQLVNVGTLDDVGTRLSRSYSIHIHQSFTSLMQTYCIVIFLNINDIKYLLR